MRSLNDSLDPRERDVIRGYFGLDGGERQTLSEIGGSLGVTREACQRAIARLPRCSDLVFEEMFRVEKVEDWS